MRINWICMQRLTCLAYHSGPPHISLSFQNSDEMQFDQSARWPALGCVCHQPISAPSSRRASFTISITYTYICPTGGNELDGDNQWMGCRHHSTHVIGLEEIVWKDIVNFFPSSRFHLASSCMQWCQCTAPAGCCLRN